MPVRAVSGEHEFAARQACDQGTVGGQEIVANKLHPANPNETLEGQIARRG